MVSQCPGLHRYAQITFTSRSSQIANQRLQPAEVEFVGGYLDALAGVIREGLRFERSQGGKDPRDATEEVFDGCCDEPIEGLLAHTAGFDKDANVFRIMDIWASQEQAERFIEERVRPMMEQGVEALPDPDNASPPTRETFYELHDVSVPTAMASGRPTV